MEMKDLEIRSTEALVEHFAPELAPRLGWGERFGPYLAGLVLALWLVQIAIDVTAGPLVAGRLAAVVAAALTMFFVVGEGGARLSQAADRRNHARWLRESPLDFQERLVGIFDQRIQARRHELLGDESEAGLSRQELERALHEAERSQAYWRERVEQDPSDPVIGTHAATADALASKVRHALDSLGRRTDALRRFFDRCEGRVAALKRGARDAEESRRLSGLVVDADLAIEHASLTVEAVAERFLRDADDVMSALAGIERFHLLDGAERAPVHAIEEVADRILESESRAERELESLTEGLTE